MYKYFISAFLLLAVAFSQCTSYYSAKFYREHAIPEDPLPPEIAAISSAEPFDSLSYAFMRRLCPGKLSGFIDKAVKLAVSKKLISKNAALASLVLSEMKELYSDALNPRAMSYTSARRAMAAAIANAYSAGISCDAIERAAALYYNYGVMQYEKEICSGKSTLEEVVKILKKGGKSRIEATSYGEMEYGKIKKGGGVNKNAEELLGKSVPVCHPCLLDFINRSKGRWFYSALGDAILEVAEDCPVKAKVGAREAVLFAVINDTYYFEVGHEEKPVLVVKNGGVENLLDERFTGEITAEGQDLVLDLGGREVKSVQKLHLDFLPALGLVVFSILLWRWKKNEN